MKKPGKKRHKREPRSKVFISYSHADAKWKDRFLVHFGVSRREGQLETWDDDRIATGEKWRPAIRRAIHSASAALMLVSGDFLNSGFIRDEEVPRLMQLRKKKGLRVFPVIVRPCLWKRVRWLSQMQVRPENAKPLDSFGASKRDQVIVDIVDEITSLPSPARHGKKKRTAPVVPRISLI